MKTEERQREYDQFLAVIYAELEKVLQKRPKNPVQTFARKILLTVNLNEEGEELPEGFEHPKDSDHHSSDEGEKK